MIGTGPNTEEVVVKGDAGANTIDVDDVPVVLSNDHLVNEPIFTRNIPYGSGILYTQTAAAMDLSVGTVKREWRYIKRWLFTQVTDESESDGS